MHGVTIGDNTVIGAGSVVSKGIPANCVAMGIPCKVVREIGEKDRKYYFRDREIDVFEKIYLFWLYASKKLIQLNFSISPINILVKNK